MSSQKAGNNVRSLRERLLMSKAELARRAGISPLTVHRVEDGAECRVETKRKIILALGKTVDEKEDVFPNLAFKRKNQGQGQEEVQGHVQRDEEVVVTRAHAHQSRRRVKER